MAALVSSLTFRRARTSSQVSLSAVNCSKPEQTDSGPSDIYSSFSSAVSRYRARTEASNDIATNQRAFVVLVLSSTRERNMGGPAIGGSTGALDEEDLRCACLDPVLAEEASKTILDALCRFRPRRRSFYWRW